MAAPDGDAVLGRLEARLAALEMRVYGENLDSKQCGEVLNSLLNVSQKVKQFEDNSKTVRQVFSRLGELEQCIELCHADTFVFSEEAKVEAVLAENVQVPQLCKQLEQLNQLRPVLDSEHLQSKVGSQIGSKMSNLCHIHADQEILVQQSLANTRQLIDKYNSIIDGLSAQLLRWNDLVVGVKASVAASTSA